MRRLSRKIYESRKKEGLRCGRKSLPDALSHVQETFMCETIPHDSLSYVAQARRVARALGASRWPNKPSTRCKPPHFMPPRTD